MAGLSEDDGSHAKEIRTTSNQQDGQEEITERERGTDQESRAQEERSRHGGGIKKEPLSIIHIPLWDAMREIDQQTIVRHSRVIESSI
jgi:hypothetical protein